MAAISLVLADTLNASAMVTVGNDGSRNNMDIGRVTVDGSSIYIKVGEKITAWRRE